MIEAYCGDTVPIIILAVLENENGTAPDLAGAKWVVSLKPAGSARRVLARKSPEAGGATGELTVTVDTKNVRAVALLDSDDTAKLRGEYSYDLVTETADGFEKTIWLDTIRFLPRVSDPIA